MTIFAGFDRIRIINLPARPDRRAEMTEELRRLGLASDPRVEFVDGIVAADAAPFRKTGEKGVFLAHLKILSEAAQAGASVLILEDDVDFTPAAQAWGMPPNCDIAYGGYEASDVKQLERSNIVGAHCMGFSAPAARALAPFLTKLLEHESPPPIDGAYVWFRREHTDLRTNFAQPVIAVQRPSRSDITPARAFDRISFLRGPVRAGRSLKRFLLRGQITFGLREAIVLSVVGIAITIIVAYYQSR